MYQPASSANWRDQKFDWKTVADCTQGSAKVGARWVRLAKCLYSVFRLRFFYSISIQFFATVFFLFSFYLSFFRPIIAELNLTRLIFVLIYSSINYADKRGKWKWTGSPASGSNVLTQNAMRGRQMARSTRFAKNIAIQCVSFNVSHTLYTLLIAVCYIIDRLIGTSWDWKLHEQIDACTCRNTSHKFTHFARSSRSGREWSIQN